MSDEAQFDMWKRAFDSLTESLIPRVPDLPPLTESDDIDDDSDIVERLRYNASLSDGFLSRESGEAADEIERLRLFKKAAEMYERGDLGAGDRLMDEARRER